jgi:hypothetical protein
VSLHQEVRKTTEPLRPPSGPTDFTVGAPLIDLRSGIRGAASRGGSRKIRGEGHSFLGVLEQFYFVSLVVQNTDDRSILKSYGGIEMVLWDLRVRSGTSPSTHSWEARQDRDSVLFGICLNLWRKQ